MNYYSFFLLLFFDIVFTRDGSRRSSGLKMEQLELCNSTVYSSSTGYWGDFYGCEEACATNQVTFSCRNEQTGAEGCMQITKAVYYCDWDSEEFGDMFNDVGQILADMCDGKSNCTFHNKDPNFKIGEDPSRDEKHNKICKDAMYSKFKKNVLFVDFICNCHESDTTGEDKVCGATQMPLTPFKECGNELTIDPSVTTTSTTTTSTSTTTTTPPTTTPTTTPTTPTTTSTTFTPITSITTTTTAEPTTPEPTTPEPSTPEPSTPEPTTPDPTPTKTYGVDQDCSRPKILNATFVQTAKITGKVVIEEELPELEGKECEGPNGCSADLCPVAIEASRKRHRKRKKETQKVEIGTQQIITHVECKVFMEVDNGEEEEGSDEPIKEKTIEIDC